MGLSVGGNSMGFVTWSVGFPPQFTLSPRRLSVLHFPDENTLPLTLAEQDPTPHTSTVLSLGGDVHWPSHVHLYRVRYRCSVRLLFSPHLLPLTAFPSERRLPAIP
jgi:hypothetical protein